jgi:hypothetical protein
MREGTAVGCAKSALPYSWEAKTVYGSRTGVGARRPARRSGSGESCQRSNLSENLSRRACGRADQGRFPEPRREAAPHRPPVVPLTTLHLHAQRPLSQHPDEPLLHHLPRSLPVGPRFHAPGGTVNGAASGPSGGAPAGLGALE